MVESVNGNTNKLHFVCFFPSSIFYLPPSFFLQMQSRKRFSYYEIGLWMEWMLDAFSIRALFLHLQLLESRSAMAPKKLECIYYECSSNKNGKTCMISQRKLLKKIPFGFRFSFNRMGNNENGKKPPRTHINTPYKLYSNLSEAKKMKGKARKKNIQKKMKG